MIRAREKKREGLGDEESGGCFFLVKAERWQRQGGCLRFRMPPFHSWRNLVVHDATVRHVYPFHYALRIFINANLKNLQGQNIKGGSIN